MNYKKLLPGILLFCAMLINSAAQFPYGIMPSGADINDAKDLWNTYKSQHVRSDGTPDPSTMLRVADNSSASTKEYLGMGMIGAAVLEDTDEIYQKLWNYCEHYLLEGMGLVPWIIYPTGGYENNAVSDMSGDIAMSLDIAAIRWGGKWEKIACEYIRNEKKWKNRRDVIMGDPSGAYLNYFWLGWTPRFYYRTNDIGWINAVVDSCYNLMEWSYNNLHAPAWYVEYQTGEISSPKSDVPSKRFNGGATRTGWRIGTHYLITGNSDADKWCKKIEDFYQAHVGDNVSNLREIYKVGSLTFSDGPKPGIAHISSAGVVAMATGNQTMADNAYSVLDGYNLYDGAMADGAALMAMMVMTGAIEPYLTNTTSKGPYFPEIEVTSISNGQTFAVGDDISINVVASDADGTIQEVRYYDNHQLEHTSNQATSSYVLQNAAEGIHSIYIEAEDDYPLINTSDEINIFVGDPQTLRPYSGTPFSIPGTIEAEHFDNGGEGVSWHDATPGNIKGDYPDRDGIDVDVKSIAGGDLGEYAIAFTQVDKDGMPEWVEYSVYANETMTVDITLSTTTALDERACHIEIDGIDVTGNINIPVTGGWNKSDYTDVTIGDISISQGYHIVRVSWDIGGFNLDKISFVSSSGNNPPTANAGDDITIHSPETSATLTGSGNDIDGTIDSYEWVQISGPSTATIESPNSATTNITNLDGGIYEFKLTVTDNGGASDYDVIEVNVFTMPSCYKLPSQPTIDALDDGVYGNSTAILNQTRGGTYPSESDVSGSWKTAWDDQYFYVFVSVTDEQLVADGTWYMDDLVEIYIDGDNSKASEYDANDFQYAYVWNSGGIREEAHGATNGVLAAQESTANGYNTEIAFPWSTLNISTPSIGDVLGVDFHICDDDDGGTRDDKLAWYDETDDAYHNPSVFGEIELADIASNIGQIATGQNVIKVYPNPVKDDIIYFSVTTDFEMFNTIGYKVLSGTNTNSIDVSKLNNGLYFIKTGATIHKIIIE
jgi:hypothetical protein